MDLLFVVELIQLATVVTGVLYLHFVARPRFESLEESVARIEGKVSP